MKAVLLAAVCFPALWAAEEPAARNRIVRVVTVSQDQLGKTSTNLIEATMKRLNEAASFRPDIACLPELFPARPGRSRSRTGHRAAVKVGAGEFVLRDFRNEDTHRQANLQFRHPARPAGPRRRPVQQDSSHRRRTARRDPPRRSGPARVRDRFRSHRHPNLFRRQLVGLLEAAAAERREDRFLSIGVSRRTTAFLARRHESMLRCVIHELASVQSV